MIALQAHPEGVVVPVRAQAGARVNAIRGEQNGALKVAVTQVAEKGKANEAIVEVLSRGLGVKRSRVSLIAGATSPEKRFLVQGCGVEQLAERIRTILGTDADS